MWTLMTLICTMPCLCVRCESIATLFNITGKGPLIISLLNSALNIFSLSKSFLKHCLTMGCPCILCHISNKFKQLFPFKKSTVLDKGEKVIQSINLIRDARWHVWSRVIYIQWKNRMDNRKSHLYLLCLLKMLSAWTIYLSGNSRYFYFTFVFPSPFSLYFYTTTPQREMLHVLLRCMYLTALVKHKQVKMCYKYNWKDLPIINWQKMDLQFS